MASTRYFIKSKSNNCSIYVRLTIDRKSRFDKKTSFTVNYADWSQSKGRTKGKDETQKVLNNSLSKLSSHIISECNAALISQTNINSVWLQKTIDRFNGKSQDDSEWLVDWFDKYIKYLPTKNKTGSDKIGVQKSTIKKYENVKDKVVRYQNRVGIAIKVKEVNEDFQEKFIEFLSNEEKLSDNTTGRLLKFLKTVCLYAKRKNVEVHPELENIKGFSTEPARITLTFDELEKIKEVTFKKEALENARDWLIIGCHLGQRVSDLLNLTSENIKTFGDYEIISLVQRKTNKLVAVPINDEVKNILKKRNGEFPRKIGDQKFNKHIKAVAKEAGLIYEIEGAKIEKVKIKLNGDKEEREITRKVRGKFPKCELITSHICRRSYATNYYGEIPTSLLISVTGHATERQFLEYVGKSPIDQALQLAKMYAELSSKRKKDSQEDASEQVKETGLS